MLSKIIIVFDLKNVLTNVPMNTVIEVRDDNYASWNKRVFVFYDEGADFPFVCISNATASAKAVCWKYARLPEEVKIASYLKEE